MADNESRMVIDFGGQLGPQEFRSLEAFEKWFSHEHAQWEWLTTTHDLNVGSVAELVRGALTQVRGLINSWRDGQQPIEHLVPHVDLHYRIPDGYLRVSEGAMGSSILDIRESAGEIAAAFAYAFHLKRVTFGNADKVEQIRGVLLFAVPGLTDAADLSARLARERANFKSAQMSGFDRLQKAYEEQERRFAHLFFRARNLGRRALRTRWENWNAAKEEWQTRGDTAVDDINAVKKAFEESMSLQGPVRYWTNKARTHGEREARAVIAVALFFIAAIVGLGFAFWTAANFVVNSATESAAAGTAIPTALYVLVAGGLAALSTLIFWVGRLLTKLYLSEHHLRNDAHERAVMTTTYLALTRNEKAEEIDRQIILNALFRSTPDGIVKEEGATDFTFQAALARVFTKP